MPSPNAKNIHLPWHQRDEYWMTIYPKAGSFSAPVRQCLEQAGFQPSSDESMLVHTGNGWKSMWDGLYATLGTLNALGDIGVIFAPDTDASAKYNKADGKSPADIQHLADSMWLGDALLDDRLMCYLQPVMDANDKIFGYESFARVKGPDGKIIGGDKIVAASRALGIEFMIDRMLHIQAVKTFVGSDFQGFLFVNFFPGFIHRPAVYLEGLSETAKSFGVVARHIVLDFTNSEIPRDIRHLNSVCDYARSRGYSIALDDIASLDNSRKLIPEIRPDFIKIDMLLVREVMTQGKREIIRGLVEMAHKVGCTVIAEGVETQEIHQTLKTLGVDLFQGYLFSPPVPVDIVLARSAGTAV